MPLIQSVIYVLTQGWPIHDRSVSSSFPVSGLRFPVLLWLLDNLCHEFNVPVMIDLTKYYYFIFGVLTIAGGVMGYVKAGSPASIIAGGIAGILLIGAGLLFATHTQPGIILGLIVSIALAGRFLPAFLKTYTFMPAGMMSILSVIGVILGALSLIFFKR